MFFKIILAFYNLYKLMWPVDHYWWRTHIQLSMRSLT